MENYKIASEYDLMFRHYALTELMTRKNGKKKQIGANDSVYAVLSSVLPEYGIYPFGSTHIEHYAKTDCPVEVTGCSIGLDFPLENFFVLKQMYGWDDSCVDIQLSLGEKFDGDCAYSFTLNTVDDSIVFNRWVYSSATSIKYNSLGDLFAALNNVEYAVELFERNLV